MRAGDRFIDNVTGNVVVIRQVVPHYSDPYEEVILLSIDGETYTHAVVKSKMFQPVNLYGKVKLSSWFQPEKEKVEQ